MTQSFSYIFGVHCLLLSPSARVCESDFSIESYAIDPRKLGWGQQHELHAKKSAEAFIKIIC